ncbi:hypothetical protein E2C01_100096 [Portunus trituberculatus]|uniref:Uncharacterized protein n=4 Tax=Pleocyemata TaxID=6692 RepID=A0A5B7KB58_PORTR|nr:hypothetical protein [Portunus trituberculatus]
MPSSGSSYNPFL